MALSFDATAYLGYYRPGTAAWAHVCDSTAKLIVVGRQEYTGDAQAAPTYAGVTMTQIETQQADQDADNPHQHSFWYLLNPAPGSNNVSYSVGTYGSGVGTSVSYKGGVPIIGDTAYARAVSATPTVTNDSTANFVVSCLSMNGDGDTFPNRTPGSGETENGYGKYDSGDNRWSASQSILSKSNSDSMAPTISASVGWVHFIVGFSFPAGNQVIWFMYEKGQKFLEDLRRGLIPEWDFSRRYNDALVTI